MTQNQLRISAAEHHPMHSSVLQADRRDAVDLGTPEFKDCRSNSDTRGGDGLTRDEQNEGVCGPPPLISPSVSLSVVM